MSEKSSNFSRPAGRSPMEMSMKTMGRLLVPKPGTEGVVDIVSVSVGEDGEG